MTIRSSAGIITVSVVRRSVWTTWKGFSKGDRFIIGACRTIGMARQVRESFTQLLRKALVKKVQGRDTSTDEDWALKTYFAEGFTFMSDAEYRARVSRGDFKGVRGGCVTVYESGRVNIHTRVGVRQT